MSELIEYLDLGACGIPCKSCPVGSLTEEERSAVDLVLQQHEHEIAHGVNVTLGDTEAETYQASPVVTEWAADALGLGAHTTKANMVAMAVTKIVNEGCSTYSEGEI